MKQMATSFRDFTDDELQRELERTGKDVIYWNRKEAHGWRWPFAIQRLEAAVHRLEILEAETERRSIDVAA
jgi:hypothetical protein